jgi:phage protein U
MFAQLGTTIFDGLKSFVSFQEDGEDAILVEHALISRKPTLQGTAIGLKNLSISLYLHQEFCNVEEETIKLRNSKNTFEILPLLWGNGKLEGEFLIATFNRTIQLADPDGNAIAVIISLTLKENSTNDRLSQEQQQSKSDAFAVGDKKPAVKSARKNEVSCSNFVSKEISLIQSNANAVDGLLIGYKALAVNNIRVLQSLVIIKQESIKLMQPVTDSNYPCIYGKTDLVVTGNKVVVDVNNLADKINYYEINPTLADAQVIGGYNLFLQRSIRALKNSVSSVLSSSITRK